MCCKLSRPLCLIAIACCLLSVIARAQSAPPPVLNAHAWLLQDETSGQVLAAYNANEHMEPASLTKLMTAWLVFAALKNGELELTRTVPVSKRAWQASGSRMFIAPHHLVTVEELLHGMIVQSGNDAAIALAEAVAGSEENFVARMNLTARRLGLHDTHFTNATGLPDAQHYSTAADLAHLAAAIVREFPQFYPLFAQKEYRYSGITQPNRNRLLWLDASVDGLKTGHSSSAGYNLVASARRGPRRLIAVLLNANSETQRTQEALKLINYGFLSFAAVRLYEKNQALVRIRVYKGTEATVGAGFDHDFILSLPPGLAEKFTAQVTSIQPLLAPVAQGQRIGTLQLMLEGKVWGEYPVVALEDAPLAGVLSRAWDAFMLWFK